jgi:hypothetical protein
MNFTARTAAIGITAVVALTAGLLAVAPAASAQDDRPCVSRVEFRAAPGMSYMNTKTNPGRALDRKQLEEFWGVSGLGVVDPRYSGRHSTMWMYPICGYSFSDAQVWVIIDHRSGPATLAMRWREPGAMSNGHQE